MFLPQVDQMCHSSASAPIPVLRSRVHDHLLDRLHLLGPSLDHHLYPLVLEWGCVFECPLCLEDDSKQGVLKPEGR